MTDILTHVAVWLNLAANALGRVLVFIGFLPGWLSATIIAVVSGVAMLIAFKYTSKQQAIKRARQEIRANLLAVKLFHDSMWVGFRAQGRVLLAALRLLSLAIVPILVLLIPASLLLGQLALWYQARPLRIGEQAVITLKMRGPTDLPGPLATLQPSDAIEDLSGPVRIASQGEICWSVRAQKDGCHRLIFGIDGAAVEKEIAIGNAYLCVSGRRPDWDWSDALLHPREEPFAPHSPVQSIDIQYPARSSWTSGTDSWVYYWFAVALVTGFCCRGLFKVNL